MVVVVVVVLSRIIEVVEGGKGQPAARATVTPSRTSAKFWVLRGCISRRLINYGSWSGEGNVPKWRQNVNFFLLSFSLLHFHFRTFKLR